MQWDGGLFLAEQENKDNFPTAAANGAGCTRNNLMHRDSRKIEDYVRIHDLIHSQEEKRATFKVLDAHCTSRRAIVNSF